MTLTAQDAHSAERLIMVGCDDAAVAPYAQVLRLAAYHSNRWADMTRRWLSEHVLFDTTTLALFVEPQYREAFERTGLEQVVSDHFDQCRINTNTICNRSASQGRNVVSNLRRIADGQGQDALRALPSMRGQTAVVCGAGPSLDDCYEALSCHAGPIVAVNTSAGALISHGFEPDFIVCTESKRLDEWKNAAWDGRSVLMRSRINIPVAIDLMAHPTHPDGIGPVLYFCSQEPSLTPYARALGLRPIGYGPSCTTAAVSLCLALGAEKVLLVGQDCCFRIKDPLPGELTEAELAEVSPAFTGSMYASGTPYEHTRVVSRNGKTADIRKPTKGTSEADVVFVPGIHGPEVTMPSMLSFVHWFAGQPESIRKRVVNCSSHGVRIEGIEHRPLMECVSNRVYRGELQESGWPKGSCSAWNAGYEALYDVRGDLLYIDKLLDPELVELAQEIPLLNFWTNPAKLKHKMANARFDPYSYGKAIADAVRQAKREIDEVLGG